MTAPISTIEHQSLTETLDLSKITINHEEYCRPVSDYKVLMMITAGFDPKALGFVHLHLESDGTYSILDGQHRVAMLQKLGINELPAKIFMDLSYPEKAALTKKLNDTNRQSATNKFRYRFHYREPRAVGIVKVVREFGLDVEVEGADRGRGAAGIITCLSALDEAYADLEEDGFRHIIDVIYRAWGTNRQAWVTYVVSGMRQFWARYHEDVDKQRLISKLKRVSIDELFQEAGASGVRSENKSSRIGKAITKIYNSQLKSRRLAPWVDYTGTRLYKGERTDWAKNAQIRRQIKRDEKVRIQVAEPKPATTDEATPETPDLSWLY